MHIGAGIDVGSTTIKLTVIENGVVARCEEAPTGSRPLDIARSMLATLPAACPIVATGYGRDMVEEACDIRTVTEIKAHAAGARFLDPNCSTVIDIGGQDVKVISLDAHGRVAKFEMNDRCAAGTGRFIEIMAQRLGLTLETFVCAASQGSGARVTINSMCTVFAESEVIGLIGRGYTREDIGYALHASMAKRIAAMFSRLAPHQHRVLATGGGSKNTLLVSLIGDLIGAAIVTHDHSRFAGAIGCSLFAQSTPILTEAPCPKQP